MRRLAGGVFDYVDLGEQSLKGIAQPTRAYRIAGVSHAASRFEAATQTGLTPLVGREHEIAMLLERWQLAQDGEGQVVLLSGEPGIGKSRILSALLERLEDTAGEILPVPPFPPVAGGRPKEGTHMPPLAKGAARSAGGFGSGEAGKTQASIISLRFQCSPYYVNSAFYPIIDNFERALKFGRDETPSPSSTSSKRWLSPTMAARLQDVRFIAAMLSIPCEDRYGALAMTPQKHKDETLRSLVDLTEAAATQTAHGDAVRGCALGRSHQPGSARSVDRPGENHPAADRADPSARVSGALVAARPCDGAEPLQAHARAKQRDRRPSLPGAKHFPPSCSGRSWPRPTGCRCLWKN